MKLSNHAAALTLFVAWYVAAVGTTLVATERYERMLPLFGIVLLSVIGFMTLVFVVSRIAKRTDVVDMAWGPAFVVAAIVSFSIAGYGIGIGKNVQSLVTLLVIIWAARLAFVIFQRLRKKPEDVRYVELRKKWKGSEPFNTYTKIFLTQAVLATIISIAVINVNIAVPKPIGVLVLIGTLVWLTGFLFEAVGDFQLKRFLSNPKNKGKLMTKGLWKYTRHPNYFGEATMWWGIFIIGLSVPYGWIGIITPVVITYLLYFVSGVPMTEKAFEGKPGWNQYKRQTSKFFPLPPVKD